MNCIKTIKCIYCEREAKVEALVNCVEYSICETCNVKQIKKEVQIRECIKEIHKQIRKIEDLLDHKKG